MSYYYWLDEKVANAILDSYLAKVMGGATYFTVYENHSKCFIFQKKNSIFGETFLLNMYICIFAPFRLKNANSGQIGIFINDLAEF